MSNRRTIRKTIEPGIQKVYDTRTGRTSFCPKYSKEYLGSFSSLEEAREVRRYALDRLKSKNSVEDWKKRIDKMAQ